MTNTPIRLRVMIATAVVAVAALAAYLFMADTLRWTDPAGARACSMLSDALDGRALSLKLSGDIGDVAKGSTTPAIRATVHVNTSLGPELDALAYLDELHTACVASGVDMPAYTG